MSKGPKNLTFMRGISMEQIDEYVDLHSEVRTLRAEDVTDWEYKRPDPPSWLPGGGRYAGDHLSKSTIKKGAEARFVEATR